MIQFAGVILARMDSSRFPRKALTPVSGVPLIERCLKGVERTNSFVPILATTARPVDDPLADFAEKKGVLCYRGDLGNVYQRVCGCLREHKIDTFARINGDSPFVQPDLLNDGLNLLNQKNCDFVTNLVPRRFPYGVSVEIFRSEFFLNSEKSILTSEHREHISSYFYQNLDDFSYASIVGEADLSTVRLTIDTPEDLNVVEQLLKKEPRLFDCPLQHVVDLYQSTLLDSEKTRGGFK
ncbi:spore coat polysaccharide biosynthesis protein SpsF [Malonomonas rubra DSM 5091]|uniref:Spore coat polysaccharide biosynthesis protein SpsF n=1 Tax=Malonomonas rubra DSM 5091 TaxID=1122189 RepID=A0A1M6MAF0_MALRU|nr:NTP transferase domain-containing protein [Malonomonas rubra]SHJ80384.1 spore coat polysaccharide biosynthesis protein SpsF [Malonomonas rubra DSM 5091]